MSDIHKVREKTAQGKEWRGTINFVMDGDEMELTVRQLQDPEYFHVMSMIDMDEIRELQGDLPEEQMERYRELQSKEDLTEEEVEELTSLEEELGEATGNIFEVLSHDTFNAIVMCGKFAVEPDEDDLRELLMDDEWVREKEDEGYGPIKVPEDCYEPFKDDIKGMIDSMTNFTSFAVGMQALMETVEDEKN